MKISLCLLALCAMLIVATEAVNEQKQGKKLKQLAKIKRVIKRKQIYIHVSIVQLFLIALFHQYIIVLVIHYIFVTTTVHIPTRF